MSLKMQQHMAMKQQLRMTQQLQQAIKLLQLSKMELVSHIQAEMTENPTLDELSADEPSSPLDSDLPPIPEAPPPNATITTASDHPTPADEALRRDDIDWSAYLEYYQDGGPLPQNSYRGFIHEELPSLEATLSAPSTLTEHLAQQVRLSRLDHDQQQCAAYIIGNLNEDGYLSGISLEDIATRVGVDIDTAEFALEIVQECEPIGVAARDLRECLSVQAEVLYPDDSTVYRLIQDFIPQLERKNYEAISRASRLPLDEILRAAKIISLMDPKPGRRFCDDAPQYITPDIYVYKVGDEYQVVLNEDGMPKLRVSAYYNQMIRSRAAGKDAGSYVRDKLAGARWLIRSIHQRQRTIQRVTAAIVARQRDFLDFGISQLKPMVLRDIADETGLHESTISRVTSKKYVHTPQGTFELKYFFNSRISRTEGDDLASESVKQRIKSIIDAEPPTRPYSDQKIVAVLKEQNIEIARRTVAKYREAMGILSSNQRKNCF
jgi:RNA polymerase sigma-54 factor